MMERESRSDCGALEQRAGARSKRNIRDSRRVRVVGSGRLTRLFVVLASVGFVMQLWIAASTPAAQSAMFAKVVLFVVLGAPLLFALRSLFLGVWLYGDFVLVCSWFRTVKLSRSDIASCSTNAFGSGPIASRANPWLLVLVVKLADGTMFRLGGTIAFARRSELQARQVQAYVQGTPIEQTLRIAREQLRN